MNLICFEFDMNWFEMNWFEMNWFEMSGCQGSMLSVLTVSPCLQMYVMTVAACLQNTTSFRESSLQTEWKRSIVMWNFWRKCSTLTSAPTGSRRSSSSLSMKPFLTRVQKDWAEDLEVMTKVTWHWYASLPNQSSRSKWRARSTLNRHLNMVTFTWNKAIKPKWAW